MAQAAEAKPRTPTGEYSPESDTERDGCFPNLESYHRSGEGNSR